MNIKSHLGLFFSRTPSVLSLNSRTVQFLEPIFASLGILKNPLHELLFLENILALPSSLLWVLPLQFCSLEANLMTWLY